MTIHELNLCIYDDIEKQKASNNDRLTIAYLGAYWQRVKRMPELKKLLASEPKKSEQSPEQILAEIKRMNAAMGGETY